MARPSPFADHCVDLFAGLGPVEPRRTFGGFGFFVGPAMLAIGSEEDWKLWLKVDDGTRGRFEEAGGSYFTYESGRGRTSTLSFVTPPDDAMEEPEAMLPWARLALDAAERAAAKRLKRRPARSASQKARPARPAPRVKRTGRR
jgi:DNA transformation protein and related proteins